MPDPKWLEILKASGWQTAALALAFGTFLYLAHVGWLPAFAPLMTQLATLGLLVCLFLCLGSMGAAVGREFPVLRWLANWTRRRRARRAVAEYIPHMTADERNIVAYLLAKNQKSFTADQDGGKAATLISRGIVIMALRPGQIFAADDVPMAIPDDVWNVLHEHKDKFPYTRRKGEAEAHPWRVSWMER